MPNWIAVSVSLLFALILAALPMPDWTVWLRPAWVLLVLIYWTMDNPYRVNIGTAWMVGLITDLINGTLLGQHALTYTIIIYIVSRMYIRLRMYPLMQQGASIFLFVLFYQFMMFCIQGFIGELPSSQLYWLSSVTSMIFWPWLYVLMRDFRRRFKIA